MDGLNFHDKMVAKMSNGGEIGKLGKTYTQSYNDWLDKHDKDIRADERKKVIDEVIGIVNALLVIGLGLENATKYGNVNSKQQANSYSTLMRYEIADEVKDLLDVLEQMKEGEG